MSDLDRKLSDALRSAGDAYRPSDPANAREEFLRRTHRRRWVFAVTTFATAAALVAVGVFVAPQLAKDDKQEGPVDDPRFGEDQVTIDVGPGARGIDFDETNGLLYVVNARTGELSQVSAETNEVVATVKVGEAPSNVAHGDAEGLWVTDPGTGEVMEIEVEDGEMFVSSHYELTDPGITMDVAVGHGYVWVASRGHVFTRIDPDTGEERKYGELPTRPTDVAVGADSVWVLDSDVGYLGDIDPTTGDVENYERAPFATSDDADLAVGPGGVWIAQGNEGVVYRVTFDHRVTADLFVGGTYAGIWVGEGSVWVASGSGDAGSLHRLDPATAQELDEPLPLAGSFLDVVTGEGSLWISNDSGGLVTRFQVFPAIGEPEPKDPDPTDEGVAEPDTFDLDDVVFVFSDEDDIHAELRDGTTRVLTTGRERDLHPTLSPDGRTLVFERVHRTGAGIFALDLGAPQEPPQLLTEGTWPTFDHDGHLAHSTMGGGARIPDIGIITDPFATNPEYALVPSTSESPPWDVRHLTWDASGGALYWQGGWEGSEVYYMETGDDARRSEPNTVYDSPNNDEAGTQFVGLASSEPGVVDVIRLCCSETLGDDHETAEFGQIFPTEGGPEYRTLRTGLEQLTSMIFYGPYVEPSGGLMFDEQSGEWTEINTRTWLLSDTTRVWVIDEFGKTYETSIEGAPGGIAVMPSHTSP